MQWSEKQVERVRKWVQEEDLASEPLPTSRGAREAAMVEQRRQELECLRKIIEIMTAQQRLIFWDLIGEPAPGSEYLQEMKAESEAASGPTKLPPDAVRE